MDEVRFWDRMAKRYDESSRSPVLQRAIDDTLISLDSDDVVLDLGCGSGPVARELAPNVQRVHGIDLSPKMIELAKRHETDRLTFAVGTLEDEGLDGRGFTAIVAFNVLHFLDTQKAFARFHQLLPAGGKLFVQAACYRDINPFIRVALAVIGRLTGMPRMSRFSAADLERGLQAAGFHVVDAAVRQKWAAVQWIEARRG